MEEQKILPVAEQWTQMIYSVLDMKKIPTEEIQNLFKETYKVLSFYCEDHLVPKKVCKLLLEMEAFLYFVSIIEGKEVDINFYYYQAAYAVAEALKEGFFGGKYECEYPMLKLRETMNNIDILDLEHGHIEDLIKPYNTKKEMLYNDN